MSPSSPPESDLRAYGQALARRKWWVIWLTLAGVVGASLYTVITPKQYTSTAQVLVQPSTGPVNLGNTQQTITPTDVATQIQLATSTPVLAAAEASLKFKPKVSVTQEGTTNVIAVSATYTSPTHAAQVANAYALAFVTYQRHVAVQNLTTAEGQLQQQINSIAAQLGSQSTNSPGAVALGNQEALLKEELAELQVYGADTGGGVELVADAQPPTSPSSPKKKQDIPIGLGAGLVLGLMVGFLVDFLDDTIHSAEELEQLLPGVPVYAVIPMIRTWRDKKTPFTVTLSDPTSVVSEAYRSLRSSLQFASYDDPIRTILITSPGATEGKTSTVVNLGVMLAMNGQSAVLVSSDLRRPRLCQFFSLSEAPGLTSVAVQDVSLEDALQKIEEIPLLGVLGSGPIPPNPAELLSSKKMADIMGSLRDRFQFVVLDSPPLLPVTDPALMARLADATLLVVNAGQTKKAQIKRAYEHLVQADAKQLGLVLNEVRKDAGYGYGYRTYGYESSSPELPLDDAMRTVSQNGGEPSKVEEAASNPPRSASTRPGSTRTASTHTGSTRTGSSPRSAGPADA